jgi:iron(III) transport system permease protein
MSAIAAVAALLWSFCVVSLVVRRSRSDKLKFISQGWRRLLSLLVLIPWALPGTVVAVSVAEAYGKPGLLSGSFVLVGTFWILPVVYFLRFMPLVVRALQASMEQLDPTLEEAAGFPWSSCVAKVFSRYIAACLAGCRGGDSAGICHCIGRICCIGHRLCTRESSDIYCYRI